MHNICKAAFFHLFNIRRNRKFLSMEFTKILFFLPFFIYAFFYNSKTYTTYNTNITLIFTLTIYLLIILLILTLLIQALLYNTILMLLRTILILQYNYKLI